MIHTLKGRSKKGLVFLVICLLFVSFPTSFLENKVVVAKETNIETKDGHGSILNEENERTYDKATIHKQITFGNKPGEYFVDLHVQGKEVTEQKPTDVVLVYDNSNSMTNRNRVGIAKAATTEFVQKMLSTNNDIFQFSLITYGSSVFDGRNRDWPAGNPTTYQHGKTGDFSFKNFTRNPADITNHLPGNVPSNRGRTWDGGTFTQQGLEEAGKLLATSNALNKVVILITDGVTTFSYADDRKSVVGDGSTYEKSHGTRTIAESKALQSKGYDIYTIGVEMAAETGISKGEAEELVRNIASSNDKSYVIDDVGKLATSLENIGNSFSDSIVGGTIVDPITGQFKIQEGENFTKASSPDMTDGQYYMTASDPALLEGVSVKVENQQLLVDGLHLGADEEVNIRYAIQIDTEYEDIKPDTLYKTNDGAMLRPAKDASDTYAFPEPEASAVSTNITGEKRWKDYGYDLYRPKKVHIQLFRQSNDEEVVLKDLEVHGDSNDRWAFTFEDLFLYDRHGETIEYGVKELEVDHYDAEIEGSIITNILQGDASISLKKEADEDTDKIRYQFTIENDGFLPLKDITLTDQMVGLTDIQYETLNGEPITTTISELVLQPGDVLIASANYDIRKEDREKGEVTNEATVEGTPTVPEPDSTFDDTPVKAEDSTTIPVEKNTPPVEDDEEEEPVKKEDPKDPEEPEKPKEPKEKEQLEEKEEVVVEIIKKDPPGEKEQVEVVTGGEEEKKEREGRFLPHTATNMYTILLIGLLLSILGVSVFIWRKKVNREV